ncbi:MAG: hypothetical protein COB59_07925 [Rhodospirillaceae bacterium]|nr:MAG: hypothetical protein COB59_07925 [Rhodospirillaceae bacterium]
MEIGRNNFASYSVSTVQSQPVPKADSVPAEKLEEPGAKTLIEEIREKGFGAYLEDMQEQKKKEMREKILESMKLTEEDLAKMSPEQRAQIEEIIANEIKKRIMANAEINQDDKTKLGLHNINTLQPNQPGISKIDAAGVGIGPLLALQEIEQNSDQIPPKEEKIAG